MSGATKSKKPRKTSSPKSPAKPKSPPESKPLVRRSRRPSNTSPKNPILVDPLLNEPDYPASPPTPMPPPNPANPLSVGPPPQIQMPRLSSKKPTNPATQQIRVKDKDRRCWALQRAGDSIERIAAKLKISNEEVEDGIRNFEAARVSVSNDIVDMAMNHELMTGIEGLGADLMDARQVLRFSGVYDANGNPIYERDWSLALEATKTLGDLYDKAKPKTGGGVNVAIGIDNKGNVNGGLNSQVKTFEQRVREKRGVLTEENAKFLTDGQGNKEIVDIVDADVDENDEDEIIDDMQDGTSEQEIEEAENVR